MADATTSSVKTFAAIMPDAIDREAGIIRGVSICTQGAAKGHGEFVDRESLKMLKALIEGFENGVKVKVDHWSGFNGIVGSIRNPRLSADRKKLLGDLYLLKKHEAYESIIELAEEMPDQFGLSISFSGVPEMKENMPYIRPAELYSVDLVDQPAANPSGLYSQSQPKKPMSDTPATPTTPADNSAAILEAINGINSKFEALETKVNALSAKPAEPAAPAAPVAPVNNEERIIQLAVKSFMAASAAAPHNAPAAPAPAAPAAPSAPAAPEKKGFVEIVNEKAAEFEAARNIHHGEARCEAIKWAIRNKPEEYSAYRASGSTKLFQQPIEFTFSHRSTNAQFLN